MSTALRLLLLARPKGLMLIALIPSVGYGFALWERGSTIAAKYVLPDLLLLWLVWALGHAGSLWLNAVLDEDEGGVLLGRSVPVPKITGPAGYVALAASLALAYPLGWLTFACTAVCAALAVAYSHPRVALKGQPVGGPLVNGFGYGSLSPIAGWAAAGGVVTWRAALTLAFIVSFILGVYFAAQAFQAEEDRRRGYRTLVVTHGPRWTLVTARMCVGLAAVGASLTAAVGAYPRLMLLTVPAWWWADRYLAAWSRAPDGGDAKMAGQWIARLSVGGLGVILAAYVDHLRALLDGTSPGGCGTAIVPEAVLQLCT